MRLLLDTHCWLWLQTEPERLGEATIDMLADPANELRLSAASAWEIAIEYGLGELPLPQPPHLYVPERMRDSGTSALAVAHAHAVAELPPHHRDPFDRLLSAQARFEELPILTADRAVAAYDVDVRWAGGD